MQDKWTKKGRIIRKPSLTGGGGVKLVISGSTSQKKPRAELNLAAAHRNRITTVENDQSRGDSVTCLLSYLAPELDGEAVVDEAGELEPDPVPYGRMVRGRGLGRVEF